MYLTWQTVWKSSAGDTSFGGGQEGGDLPYQGVKMESGRRDKVSPVALPKHAFRISLTCKVNSLHRKL